MSSYFFKEMIPFFKEWYVLCGITKVSFISFLLVYLVFWEGELSPGLVWPGTQVFISFVEWMESPLLESIFGMVNS